jgi:hypothetical protein
VRGSKRRWYQRARATLAQAFNCPPCHRVPGVTRHRARWGPLPFPAPSDSEPRKSAPSKLLLLLLVLRARGPPDHHPGRREREGGRRGPPASPRDAWGPQIHHRAPPRASTTGAKDFPSLTLAVETERKGCKKKKKAGPRHETGRTARGWGEKMLLFSCCSFSKLPRRSNEKRRPVLLKGWKP